MDIHDLRMVGKRLLGIMAPVRDTEDMKIPEGTGAGGDKTFRVDKVAEESVLSSLSSLGESLTIVSEEAGTINLRGGGPTVLIDPIDGSKNAVAGIPFYGTSIAVAHGDTLAGVRLSYVMNLVTGDEFWAEAGAGAFMNNKPIRSQKDPEFYLIAYEAPIPSRDIPPLLHLLTQARKARCLGATALDLAYLSSGAVSVFVTASPSRSFDFAGGYLLVKEAGGIVTDAAGNAIENVPLGLSRSASILAAGSRRLHEKALSFLHSSEK